MLTTSTQSMQFVALPPRRGINASALSTALLRSSLRQASGRGDASLSQTRLSRLHGWDGAWPLRVCAETQPWTLHVMSSPSKKIHGMLGGCTKLLDFKRRIAETTGRAYALLYIMLKTLELVAHAWIVFHSKPVFSTHSCASLGCSSNCVSLRSMLQAMKRTARRSSSESAGDGCGSVFCKTQSGTNARWHALVARHSRGVAMPLSTGRTVSCTRFPGSRASIMGDTACWINARQCGHVVK
mmetsp:Transcript_74315/g.143949  ORF Transcript_74315/g.143949 Transcript_74315/m.143949 type:complete len:241 (-) Transcript_74315:312-1034(-)